MNRNSLLRRGGCVPLEGYDTARIGLFLPTFPLVDKLTAPRQFWRRDFDGRRRGRVAGDGAQLGRCASLLCRVRPASAGPAVGELVPSVLSRAWDYATLSLWRDRRHGVSPVGRRLRPQWSSAV